MTGLCFPLIIGHDRPLSECQQENQRQWLPKSHLFPVTCSGYWNLDCLVWREEIKGTSKIYVVNENSYLSKGSISPVWWACDQCSMHIICSITLNHTFLVIKKKGLWVDMVGGLWFKRSAYTCTWEPTKVKRDKMPGVEYKVGQEVEWEAVRGEEGLLSLDF